MSESLSPSPNLAGAGDGGTPIKASHLNGDNTLRAGQKTVVFDEPVPADKVRWFGHGHDELPTGVAHKYADLVDSAGNDIEGDVFVRVTDSSGNDVLANRRVGDVGTLSDALDEPRTERPAMPALAKYANPHRRMQVVIALDENATADGNTVDPSASSMRLWYTESN